MNDSERLGRLSAELEAIGNWVANSLPPAQANFGTMDHVRFAQIARAILLISQALKEEE